MKPVQRAPAAAAQALPSSLRRAMLRWGLAVPAAGLVGGCNGLVSRPALVKHTFLLDPPLPAPVAGPPKPIAVRVGAINVAAAFRGKQFVFRRGDLAYESDFYDEWFVPPATMLADAVAKALAAARVFQRVVPHGTAGSAEEFLLEGFASAFYGDARTTAQAAELAITFYLTAVDVPGSAPVWSKEYSARRPLAAAEADALAGALNAALGTILRDLAADLAAASLGKG